MKYLRELTPIDLHSKDLARIREGREKQIIKAQLLIAANL